METMRDLQEIALLLVMAETIEERRRLHELLRSTQTEIESSDEVSSVGAEPG